jgi:hypothetical protein
MAFNGIQLDRRVCVLWSLYIELHKFTLKSGSLSKALSYRAKKKTLSTVCSILDKTGSNCKVSVFVVLLSSHFSSNERFLFEQTDLNSRICDFESVATLSIEMEYFADFRSTVRQYSDNTSNVATVVSLRFLFSWLETIYPNT